MARFQFPGKPGKFSVRKRRVLASKLRDKGGKMGGAEITGRFIADFYAMVGDSDEEEDPYIHGFSTDDVDRARDIYSSLSSQADEIREEVWLARGVLLDRADRVSIQTEHAAKAARFSSTPNRDFAAPLKISESPASCSMVERTFPTFELESTSNNATPTQTVKAKCYKRKSTGFTHKKVRKVNHVLPKPQTVQLTEKVTRKPSLSSSSNKRRSVNQKEVGGSGEAGLAKPRVQIEIPSWRRVEDRLAAPTDWRRMEGHVEDSRDQVYTARHSKAELEEQDLWEKWQTLRTEAGKQIKGRSKSRGWREVRLPGLRVSSRVSSLNSEDSFSGRLSPRSGQLETIQVVTAPPTPVPADEENHHHCTLLSSSSNHFISSPKHCDILPLSPPLSPVGSSVLVNGDHDEPASEFLSPVKTRRKSSNEQSVKQQQPGILAAVLRPVLAKLQQPDQRVRLSGSGSKKRLTSPKKTVGRPLTVSRNSAGGRDLYPLRSLHSPRKTRQGARR